MEAFLLYIFCGMFLIVVFFKFRKLEKKVLHLDSLSTHDELTGLLNLRGGNQIMEHHHSGLMRDPCERNNFAVLNLDLNRFKGINDKYGHKTGDQVLKFFGEILTKNLNRGQDVVIRVGGDEFVVFLPECSLLQAEAVKAKIKNALLAEPFESNGLKLSLRTSVGIATALTENGGVLSLDQVHRVADNAMYADKEIEHRDMGGHEKRQ